MSAPETLAELFAASTDIGLKLADLVGHAWKIGMRDGLASGAQAVRGASELDDMPPAFAEVMRHLADRLELQCHTIDLPDTFQSGDEPKEKE